MDSTSDRRRRLGRRVVLAGLTLCACGFSPEVPSPATTSDASAASESSATDPSSSAGSSSTTQGSDATDDPDTTGAPTTSPSSTADTTSDASTDTESGVPVCGDGLVEGDEVCDDATNDGSYGSCTADCSGFAPHCGDGEVNGPEPCDDGDPDNGDGCNVDCVVSGTVLWSRMFDGDAGLDDEAFDVAVDADDSIVVAGASEIAASEPDTLLLRYADDGSLLWDELHDLGDDSRALGVAIGPSGEIGITGDLGQVAFLTSVFDGDGALVWSDPDPDVGGGDVGGRGVTFESGGDVVVAGQVYGGSYDVRVRRYNEAGNSVWTRSYDGGLTDDGTDAAIDGDALYVVGSTFVSATDPNGWIRRYDLDGTAIWSREYASADEGGDQAWSVAVDPAGDVVVVGLSAPEVGTPQGWIRKYDADGATQWTEVYDDPLGTYALGLAVDGAGQITVIGAIDPESPSAFVAKHDADGVQLWIDTPLPGSGFVWAAATDSHDRIVVVGTQGGDVWLQKYAP